nr:hypothetical protein [Clostridiales bacterium]
MNKLKKIISATLSALILFNLSAFAVEETTTQEETTQPVVQAVEPAQPVEQDIHNTRLANLQLIKSSGLLELYYDNKSYSILLKDTSKNMNWTSLPVSGGKSSIITAYVMYDGGVYTLNSQDDAVAKSAVSVENTENGLNVSYNMQKNIEDKEISVALTIEYTLIDGSFYAKIDCDNIELSNKTTLLSLDVLKGFGATSKAQKGDFIFVPDGTGAIIKTDVKDTSLPELNFLVYGGSINGKSDIRGAIAPVFGMKQGTNAFAAIIQKGDALATITAKKAENNEDGFDEVGANFTITENDGEKKTASASYKGEIEICYRFISGNNASYIGMAVVFREQMIRLGVLSTKSVRDNSEYLPMNLNVTGEAYGGKKLLHIFKQKMKLTTFEQALDMVTLLKAKGINNINLRYSGAFTGGLDQKSVFSANLLNELGGKKQFEELYEYMNSQKQGLYIDVNLLSAKDFSSSKTAKNLFGKTSTIDVKNDVFAILGIDSITKKFLKLTQLDNSVNKIMDKTEDLSFSGYCLNDFGSLLYSDYKSKSTRQEVAEVVSEQSKILSMNRKLMVSTGNFYAIKNADYIVDLDFSLLAESPAYISVPFIPAVFHGIFDYSSKAINLADDYKTYFLKSIEYGACPSFEFVYTINDK